MKYVSIIVLLFLSSAVFSQGALINLLFADEDINIFQHNAINNNSDYFNINDNLIILGNIKINEIDVVLANNVSYWGASTQKATWRFLLFLNDGTFLGMYTGIIFDINEIRIEGQKIYFPFEHEIGNVIDFSKGIPNKIWIDGYNIFYEKINDL
ncbi:MAG: hypothetical protein LBV17_01785 [Treponema sp.]|jgi:hypothetical protein|nr:hypothetical protein [Treponema sp.]